ncbi:hypothetical protein HZA57_03330 [Candidatus Poribacteria bacterium]|nr:hypothetical protein [Candidatus Poribacteria bacterium]
MALVGGVLLSGTLAARPFYFSLFQGEYPDTTVTVGDGMTQGYGCGICHLDPAGGGDRNPYGERVEESEFDFAGIESEDPDEDGLSNLAEITRSLPPGFAATPAPELIAQWLTDGLPRPDVNGDGVFDAADVTGAAVESARTGEWSSIRG